VRELEEVLEACPILSASRLECNECGHGVNCWYPISTKPDVRFECVKCGSFDTERS
jgi:hypothetical protein